MSLSSRSAVQINISYSFSELIPILFNIVIGIPQSFAHLFPVCFIFGSSFLFFALSLLNIILKKARFGTQPAIKGRSFFIPCSRIWQVASFDK